MLCRVNKAPTMKYEKVTIMTLKIKIKKYKNQKIGKVEIGLHQNSNSQLIQIFNDDITIYSPPRLFTSIISPGRSEAQFI